MLYITIFIISLLISFLIYQTKVILKYKKLENREKSFLASITHDLKSPTRAQINMLNLLLKGYFGKLNPQQYEMIKLTCNSSKYVSNLVGTLLTDYKYETSTIKLNKKIFDIIKLVNTIITENKYLIKEKDLNIIFTSQNTTCNIFADELQIHRVILNLLSNAINYGIKGTNINIRIDENYKFITFSISNKSNPVTQKEIKNIFNKFSKSKNSELNKNSTGLGLYTVKKIISLHKGSILAKSSIGGTFTISFKLNKNNEQIKTIHHKIIKNKSPQYKIMDF